MAVVLVWNKALGQSRNVWCKTEFGRGGESASRQGQLQLQAGGRKSGFKPGIETERRDKANRLLSSLPVFFLW